MSHSNNRFGPGDEVFERLLAGLARDDEPEPPADLVRRVGTKLRKRTISCSRALPSSLSGGERRKVRRAWIGVAGLAAAVLVGTLSIFLPRQVTWGQVAGAVRARPWLLLTFPSDDGLKHQEWISVARELSARRDGDAVSFHDHRLKLVYRYQPEQRIILRATETPREWKQSLDRGLERVVTSIFRGAENLESPIPDVEIAKQKRENVELDGHKWLSYDLTLLQTEEGHGQSWRMTILVDPATHLPARILMTDLDSGKRPMKGAIEISYPDPGPVDIYDLGVPRDATLIDKTPADDVQRLIAGVKASAERFGDYLVLNISGAPNAPWYEGTPVAVWQEAKKSRLVLGVVDTDAPPAEAPADNIDQHAWWKKRWTQLFHVPGQVCDGKVFWMNESMTGGSPERPLTRVWSGKQSEWPKAKWKKNSNVPGVQNSPLIHVYPENLSIDYPIEAKVESNPGDGPANTVRLVIRGKISDQAIKEDRLWIDRERSYLVVRREFVNLDTSNSPPTETLNHTFIVEKAERSPRGIWYPTVMRYSGTWKENGERKTREDITRHYFDFHTRFTEELFKPVSRAGEPLE